MLACNYSRHHGSFRRALSTHLISRISSLVRVLHGHFLFYPHVVTLRKVWCVMEHKLTENWLLFKPEALLHCFVAMHVVIVTYTHYITPTCIPFTKTSTCKMLNSHTPFTRTKESYYMNETKESDGHVTKRSTN
jgi:hypothetical protein